GFGLFQHIDHSLTAAHIDAAAPGIDEHIVGVPASVELGKNMAILSGQCDQSRRTAKGDQNPLALTIDRHWEIRSEALCRPGSVSSRTEVHGLDLAGIRYIDKDLSGG